MTLTPVQGVNDRRPREAWAVAFGHAHSDTDRVVAAGYDNGGECWGEGSVGGAGGTPSPIV